MRQGRGLHAFAWPSLLLAAGLACAPADDPADAASAAAVEGAPGVPPDVVLIVVDTLRADHLALYGHPRATSPELDALAAASSVYRRAFAPAPWTTPSIAALLTSRYPSELGIDDVPSRLSDQEWLLSEELASAGYRTGAVVSHSFCSAEWGFDQGFDSFDESNVLGHDAVTSAGVTRRAIDFLSRADGRPSFLFVHYFDPHYTYVEHPAHRFGGPAQGYDGPIRSGLRFSELKKLRRLLGPEDVGELRRIYDSEIAHTDREIGRLLAYLRDAGRLAGSLVIVTADHGEAFLEHGYLGHGKQLHDTLIHVPLVIHYPGLAPARVEHPVGLVDVAPTVLAFLGRERPAALRGSALLDPASAAQLAPAAVFAQSDRGRTLRSVIVGHHKLILEPRSGRASLFDLAADPGETRDLAASAPERVESLRSVLRRWEDRLDAPRQTPAVAIDPEERRRLESLGYL